HAVDAVAEVFGILLRLLDASTRFTAPVLVSDGQRLFVHHCRLDARPGAHVDAHLLAHEAAQGEGRERQDRYGDVGRRSGLTAPEVADQGGCVGEVHDPRTAGPKGDHQVDCPLEAAAGNLAGRPWRGIEAHAGVAVAIDEPVNVLKQIGPYGLRTGIAAPGPANGARHQEQANCGHDQQPGDEVELVRPDLDVEHVEASVGEIDQNR